MYNLLNSYYLHINYIFYIHSSYYIHNSFFKRLCFTAFKNMFIIFFCIYKKKLINYYQKPKERLRKEARLRYQNLSEREKEKDEKRSEIDIKI